MKQFVFQQIGDYCIDGENSRFRLTIEKNLKDALLKLDHFSHCVIFTKENRGFRCSIARIWRPSFSVFRAFPQDLCILLTRSDP